ncbi:hypothetical protein BGX38DRAFT_1332954 [Terfezia claveryi]|nr:hypothetical protein BGX38DRAFT_1332954 [Terfezia claveryi]
MPPLSKKRKACIASIAKACEARKAQRVLSDDSTEFHFDSEVEDSELDLGADSDVDEELVIEGDALVRLMAIASSIVDSDSLAEEPNFKYQRGVQQCDKTLYRARKKQADLQHAATNTAKITEFFTSTATVNTNSSVPVIHNQLQLAIDDLKGLLRSKRVPIGQNLNRYNTVLLFLQLQDVRKGVYVDGHEWDDIVVYRQNIFLPQIEEIQSSLRQWDKDGNIIPTCLTPEEKEKILVTHNESTFNANDGKRQMWVKNDAYPCGRKDREKELWFQSL